MKHKYTQNLLKACSGEVRAMLLGLRDAFFNLCAILSDLCSSSAYKRLIWSKWAVHCSPRICAALGTFGKCIRFLFKKLLKMFLKLCVKSKSRNNRSWLLTGWTMLVAIFWPPHKSIYSFLSNNKTYFYFVISVKWNIAIAEIIVLEFYLSYRQWTRNIKAL